jgi:hypothetical protein
MRIALTAVHATVPAIRPDGNASGNQQVAENATRTADLRENGKAMLTSYRKSKSSI